MAEDILVGRTFDPEPKKDFRFKVNVGKTIHTGIAQAYGDLCRHKGVHHEQDC